MCASSSSFLCAVSEISEEGGVLWVFQHCGQFEGLLHLLESLVGRGYLLFVLLFLADKTFHLLMMQISTWKF
jgi:hypothetical protein